MGKFIKLGRVVVMFAGCYVGKKAIIVKHYDSGNTKDKKFPHALVAGLARSPLKVTKRMGNKRIARRTRVKPFVKYVNFNHILPTRYMVGGELDLKPAVSEEQLKESKEGRKKVKQEVKKIFQEKYMQSSVKLDKTNHVAFFYKKLRF